jgi:hypothetical protein
MARCSCGPSWRLTCCSGGKPSPHHGVSMRSAIIRCMHCRLLLTVLMALWLPFQAVAAVTMPFCAHGSGQPRDAAKASHRTSVASRETHHSHQHGQPADNDPHHAGHHPERAGHHPDHTGSASTVQCNDCGACHLACSPALATSVSSHAVTTLSYHFSPRVQSPPGAHTPERQYPPPLV